MSSGTEDGSTALGVSDLNSEHASVVGVESGMCAFGHLTDLHSTEHLEDERSDGINGEGISCVWCGEQFNSYQELDIHSVSHAEPLDNDEHESGHSVSHAEHPNDDEHESRGDSPVISSCSQDLLLDERTGIFVTNLSDSSVEFSSYFEQCAIADSIAAPQDGIIKDSEEVVTETDLYTPLSLQNPPECPTISPSSNSSPNVHDEICPPAPLSSFSDEEAREIPSLRSSFEEQSLRTPKVSNFEERSQCAAIPEVSNLEERSHCVLTSEVSNLEESSHCALTLEVSFQEERLHCAGNGEPSVNEVIIPHQSSESIADSNPFLCAECSLTFLTTSQLRAHRLRAHASSSYRCNLCGSNFESRHRFHQHCVLSHSIRRLKCLYCEELFASQEFRKLHISKSHPDKPCSFPCPLCTMSFSGSVLLTKHIRSYHRGKLPFQCWCGKHFDNIASLKLHFDSHSHALFKLHCTVCFKWLPTRKLLDAHVSSSHGFLKPHNCPVCSKTFKLISSVTRHLRVSHPTSLPYRCSKCGQLFRSPTDFYGHLVQTGHMVEEVPYVFKCRACNLISFDRMQITEHEESQHSAVLTLERTVQLFSLLKEIL